MLRRTIMVFLLLVLCSSAVASGGNDGQDKFRLFLHDLQKNNTADLAFSEGEALVLVNAATEVMFVDMPLVSAYCSDVSFRNGRIEVNTSLSIGALRLRPQVTFTAKVSGEDVIMDISRMRVGILPLNIQATLSAIALLGSPDYMQIYPRSGRIIVQKRGSVVNVRGIEVSDRELRVQVGEK